ncbi:hypothetical protein JOB18_014966 [Solea senegalensis]|uniref:Uncharacterized protein n=1 Tax=Solea senegalensis TaxID=28829 RepID=A0AAV6QK07_SOLSE|nr:hypothetical protein JOB18_014966 [Solea senegalensis]
MADTDRGHATAALQEFFISKKKLTQLWNVKLADEDERAQVRLDFSVDKLNIEPTERSRNAQKREREKFTVWSCARCTRLHANCACYKKYKTSNINYTENNNNNNNDTVQSAKQTKKVHLFK